MKGRIIKITRNSVYVLTVAEWKEFQVQIAVRRKDMAEVVKLLAKPIEFELDDKGYFKLIKRIKKTGLEVS